MSECKTFELPNQTTEHLRYAEEQFKNQGADLDSKVAFVGGTLYAHDYKAQNPDAEVTVIEKNPIAAYTQRFAAYQLQNNVEPEQITEQLFNLSEHETRHKETIIDKEHYEEIIEEHQNFVENDDLFDEEFLENRFLFEPEYNAEQVYLQSLEGDADPRIENKRSSFLNTNGSIVKKWYNDLKDQHLPGGYSQQVDELIERAQEQFHEEQEINEDELRELTPQNTRDNTLLDPIDSLLMNMKEEKNKSHRRHATQEGGYIHATETQDGQIKISKNSRASSLTHEKILEEVEDLERPDEIIIADARDVEMENDILLTNNVFEYFDTDEEVRETVEGLTGDDDIFVESTNRGWAMPDGVHHVENQHGQHRSTKV